MNIHPFIRAIKPKIPYVLAFTSVAGLALSLKSAWNTFPKAQIELDEARLASVKYNDRPLEKKEEAKVVAPIVIPTVAIASLTAASMVGYIIFTRQQLTAMTAAYAMLEQKFKEYRKAVEARTDAKAMATISREGLAEDYKEECLLFYIDHYDSMFNRTSYDVLEAEYNLNKLLTKECCASLSDFFKFLHLDPTPISDMLGWDDSTPWIDFKHERVVLDDGLECYMIKFENEPSPDFLPF